MIHYRIWQLRAFCRNLWETLRGRPVVMAVVARSGICFRRCIRYESVGLKLAFHRTVYTNIETLLQFNPHLREKLPL